MERWKTKTAVMLTFFVRENTLREVFKKIQYARPRTLFLVCDGPREGNQEDVDKQERCKKIVEDISWDCEVHRLYSEKNRGIHVNTYEGLKYAFQHEEQLIFLEDDIFVSDSFFAFCDFLLEKYKNDQRIQLINGMNHLGTYRPDEQSYFFSEAGSIWGIAMWKRTFENMENDCRYIENAYACERLKDVLPDFWKRSYLSEGKRLRRLYLQDSLIRNFELSLYISEYLHNQMQIVPSKNLVTSIGLGRDSAHAPKELKMLPHNIRKLFCSTLYEMPMPLVCPVYEIPDKQYEKKFNWIMGRGSLLAKSMYWAEQIALKVRYGGIWKAIEKRTNCKSGRKKE